MLSKRLTIAVAGALVLTAAALGLLVALGDTSSTSAGDPVRVSDGSGVVQEFETVAEAEKFVEARAGFLPTAPVALPEGFRITELTFNPPPPRPGPELQRVTYKVERGSSGFTILVVNRTFDFPGKDAEHEIARPSGFPLYRTEANGRAEFTLVTEKQGWVAIVPNDLGVDSGAVVKMLESLPLR